MRGKYNIFTFILGNAFQFGFAIAFLAVLRYFLSEDPEALAYYPYLRIGLWIFWTPFIIKNNIDFFKNWHLTRMERKAKKR